MKLHTPGIVAVALLVGATAIPIEALADGPAWVPSPALRKQMEEERKAQRALHFNRGSNGTSQVQQATPREDALTRMERENNDLRRQNEAARLGRENRLLREQRAMPLTR